MSRTVTLTTLQARTLQRANLEVASNAAIYSSAELIDNINEGIAELWDLVAEAGHQHWALSSTTFATVAGTDTYAIGSGKPIAITDLYRPDGLDITFGQNQVLSAQPFMWRDRNRYRWMPGWVVATPVAYHFAGNSLKLIPIPPGVYTCTLWYVPTPPVLAAGGDTIDGYNGFEEYVVLCAAIKLLTKQEQFEHAQLLMAERERTASRVRSGLQNRDNENPERVTDVRSGGGGRFDHPFPY